MDSIVLFILKVFLLSLIKQNQGYIKIFDLIRYLLHMQIICEDMRDT
jgi:hypothetical protein